MGKLYQFPLVVKDDLRDHEETKKQVEQQSRQHIEWPRNTWLQRRRKFLKLTQGR